MLSEETASWCIVVIAVALVTGHMHAMLGSIHPLVPRVRSVLSRLCEFWSNSSKATQLRRMVAEARTQNFQSAAPICLSIAMALLIMTSLPICLMGGHGDKLLQISVLKYQLSIVVILLLATYAPIEWTPARATACVSCFNIVLLIRTYTFCPLELFPFSSGTRVAMRIISGLLDMNCQRSAIWNALFFLANVMKLLQLSEAAPLENHSVARLVVFEVVACSMVWTVCVVAEKWFTDRVCASFELQVSRTLSSNLLSVFCDAQVTLGPKLQILSSPEKLHKILAVGESDQSFDFADYLVAPDKLRFRSFIDASLIAAFDQSTAELLHARSQLSSSPLHAHMRDSAGKAIPARIFHSVLMTSEGEYQHMIGICVETPDPCTEAHLDTSHEHAALGSSPPRANSAEVGGQLDKGHQQGHEAVARHIATASHSSARSHGSSTSSGIPATAELTVCIDPYTAGLRIQSCTIDFACPDNIDDVSTFPQMSDWLSAKEFIRLRDWTQGCVNQATHGALLHPKLESLAAHVFGTQVCIDCADINVSTSDVAHHSTSSESDQEYGLDEFLGELHQNASEEDAADIDNEASGVHVKLRLSGFSCNRKLSRLLKNGIRMSRPRFSNIEGCRLPQILERSLSQM